MLCVPATNRKVFGESSFSFTGPTVWNTVEQSPLWQSLHKFYPCIQTGSQNTSCQELLCIQRDPATALFTFSSCIVQTLITCNFAIPFCVCVCVCVRMCFLLFLLLISALRPLLVEKSTQQIFFIIIILKSKLLRKRCHQTLDQIGHSFMWYFFFF